MDTVIYFILTIIYALLLIYGIISAARNPWAICSIFLLIVTAALFYDNGILAIGRYIGESELLELLNAARFWLHALFTPLLIPFTWQTLRDADVSWVTKPLVKYGVFIVTGAIIVIEVIPLFRLSLKPIWQQGVLSYTRVGGSGGGLMILGVTVAILIASIILWRKTGWKWLFIGLVLMGVVGGLTIPFDSKAIGNVSELVLILALFATQKRRGGSHVYKT
ncbi:hypothetical protein [Litchfieldia alkalitelluris]|uniref:hypothetical protein n=1 Tax=Litchfieldia alkalitelluris TaxID=304268 RepID=UPI0015937C0A|nr:hypothetical protein [Litchfieldia alkalitelluris]